MPKLTEYIVRRLLLGIPALLGVTAVVFLIEKLTPGDPVSTILGFEGASPQQIAILQNELGYNQPIFEQYFLFLWRILHANLGNSIYFGIPVSTLITQALPSTVELVFAGLLIGIALGVPLGTFSAISNNSFVDRIIRLGSIISSSLPDFWLALVLDLIFGFYLRLVPLYGDNGLPSLVLPAATLGIGMAGIIIRITRASMLEVVNKEYIMAARARGAPEILVVFKYSLRNGLIPVVTTLGLLFANLLTGDFFVEYIFAWPGLGRLAVVAMSNLDYPLVQGTILTIATFYVLINILVDVSYAFINPRIQV